MKIAIIGDGIVGLTTASLLHEKGHNVCVYGTKNLKNKASWAAGGVISPLPPWRYAAELIPLWQTSHQNYQQFCQKLKQKTSIDPQYRQTGLAVFSKNIEAEYELAKNWSNQAHSPACLKNIENQTAILLPDIAQVHSPSLCRALEADLRSRNIPFYISENPETELWQDSKHENLIHGVIFSEQYHSFEAIILCNGAWMNTLLPEQNPKISPVKGDMLRVVPSDPTISNHPIYLDVDNDVYLIPRQDGSVVIGSTLEHMGFDATPNPNSRDLLWQKAVNFYPKLANAQITHHWAGLRPGTHAVPFVQRVPNMPNVWRHGGHYRNGIGLALATAMQLAENF